ncbi:MAG: phosphatidate cytidylyltransferase [Betaproteobacteria bacterium]|nr:phosphatidate cytidylyltransferase [Betaproteobacteria bacterium]
MLKQRVITALVLLAIVLPALFSSQTQWFIALTLLLICAGGWEWGRLNGWSDRGALWGALLCAGAGGLALQMGWTRQAPAAFWALAGGAWVLLSVWMIRAGVQGWSQAPRLLRWVGGLLLLVVAWLAMAQARERGVNFLLSVLALVWVADIAAYFAGRALGGRFFPVKLAPAISPGKTWEGAVGGFIGVLLLGAAWAAFDARQAAGWAQSLHTLVWQRGAGLALLAWAFLAAMSIVGDLVESLVKRSAGVKDSSGLLPGHGGVLDRVDALLPTLPLAMMLVSWIEPA